MQGRDNNKKQTCKDVYKRQVNYVAILVYIYFTYKGIK